MANIAISVVDELSNPLLTNVFDITASTNYSFSGSNIGVFSLPDNESFVVHIEVLGYHSYTNVFQHYSIDLNFQITLIPLECKDEFVNNCCNASFLIIDNPCNNHKQLYKTSSSPTKLNVYKGTTLIGQGSVIPIPEYLACGEFTIASEEIPSCCCSPVVYPPCSDIRTIEIPCNECLCQPEWTFDHDLCYTKIYPFIDFQDSKFFNQELWYIVVDNPIDFSLVNVCVREDLWIYDQLTNSYVLIPFLPPVTITLELIDFDNQVLYTNTISLPLNFTPAQLSAFLSALTFTYTFDELGKYKLRAVIETICGEYEVIKEFWVLDDIELFVTEECKKYNLVLCNDTYDIVIRDYIKDEDIVTISVVNNVDSYTYNPSYSHYQLSNSISLEEDGILLDIEDGIYEIVVNNGFEEKRFIVVHFCKIKECYLALSEKLYCSDKLDVVENERFYYMVSAFYTLYKLLLEFYTLQHPIHIIDTSLSNIENLRFVEIDKVIKRLREICEACTSVINEADKKCCK
jgi:hypothetical protein